jgi:hypothetical protein
MPQTHEPSGAALLAAPAAHVFKSDRRSRVWRVDLGGAGSFVIKRFEYSPTRQRLACLLALHPAQRERRANRKLLAAGVPVLPIVARGCQSDGLGVRCWLATPAARGSLHDLILHDRLGAGRRGAIESAARLTATLLQRGLTNDDHKASNIVIDERGEAWLIDAGAVRRSRGWRDVSGLLERLDETARHAGATRADRLRFLRAVGKQYSPLADYRAAARAALSRPIGSR